MSRIESLVLVETSSPGNLGAALRVAANFTVPRVVLVRPKPALTDPEVRAWACGAEAHLEVRTCDTLEEALAGATTVVGTASGRGRDNLPVLDPPQLASMLRHRAGPVTLVFGNETRGLSRDAVDRCDLVLRIPTNPEFPVLNLVQAVGISLACLSPQLADEPQPGAEEPADHAAIEALMAHLERALLAIGFLDPVNPRRILRKLRRMLGRAGATRNEVTILHGICRQMLWAASRMQGAGSGGEGPGPLRK